MTPSFTRFFSSQVVIPGFLKKINSIVRIPKTNQDSMECNKGFETHLVKRFRLFQSPGSQANHLQTIVCPEIVDEILPYMFSFPFKTIYLMVSLVTLQGIGSTPPPMIYLLIYHKKSMKHVETYTIFPWILWTFWRKGHQIGLSIALKVTVVWGEVWSQVWGSSSFPNSSKRSFLLQGKYGPTRMSQEVSKRLVSGL